MYRIVYFTNGGDYNTFVDMIEKVIDQCSSTKTLVIINQ